jgi:hypothetical protein
VILACEGVGAIDHGKHVVLVHLAGSIASPEFVRILIQASPHVVLHTPCVFQAVVNERNSRLFSYRNTYWSAIRSPPIKEIQLFAS